MIESSESQLSEKIYSINAIESISRYVQCWYSDYTLAFKFIIAQNLFKLRRKIITQYIKKHSKFTLIYFHTIANNQLKF